MEDLQTNVTRCLRDLADGDEDAVDRLLPLIYDDLRALARRMYHGNPDNRTLQATALVHEAYVRLVRAGAKEYEGRGHFMRVAAMAMRQLLANHARDRRRLKRGGEQQQEELHESVAVGVGGDLEIDLIDLDDALTEFARNYPRHAKVVELRFFAGLSVEETAEILGVSPRTTKADWQLARAWLSRALEGEGDDQPEA